MRTILVTLLSSFLLLLVPSPAAAAPDERVALGLSGGVAYERDHGYYGFELELDLPINRTVVPYLHLLAYDGNTPRTGEDGTTGYEQLSQLNLGALFMLSVTPAPDAPGARFLRDVRLFLRTGVGLELYYDGLNDDNSTCLGPVITLGVGARWRLWEHFFLGVELALIKYPLSDDVVDMVKPSAGIWVNF